MNGKVFIPYFCFLLCSLVLWAGCEQDFQPFQENDQYYFSIYGYLDASADTQWIRVGTVRQDINEPPNQEGIQVQLEDLQNGETVVMNDSLFTSTNVLNYWTTMEIKSEQTYRITAERADGKTSRVTVTTPEALPPIFITINDQTPVGANIYVDDSVEHIADVQSVWFVVLNPGTENRRRTYRFPIRSTLKHTFSFFGAYFAFANWEKELEQIEQSIGGSEMSIVSRQFFVAAGGPEWDDNLSSIDDLEYFLDGTASNVENGLGFVVGVNANWFQQVPCLTPDRSGFLPCTPEDGSYW